MKKYHVKKEVLSKLSSGGIEIDASRRFADLKSIDPLKIFYQIIDFEIENKGHQIPVRIYFPSKKDMEQKGEGLGVLLFFHGGGWVTESVENYNKVCARMAKATNHLVISVDYRLAPEHPFPTGLMDCYTAAKELFANGYNYGINAKQITLIGDSAGGNLVSAVSLMARDEGIFFPKRQILIYPVENNVYDETSPYPSVMENGVDYLLTAQKMRDYVKLYIQNKDDLNNPYFTPLHSQDLSNQPDTLVITAELDPLRDEGEAYGNKLKEAGNTVFMHRIVGAMHGFFALGIMSYHVSETFQYINHFLKKEIDI